MKLRKLIYMSDSAPGITRRRCGKGFAYYDEKKKHIKKPETIKRIHQLAIPPAYESVWICPKPNGHIQATGLDEKKRKQYIYHELWLDYRNHLKFKKILGFSNKLPTIRKAVKEQLKESGFSKKKLLAALVNIIDKTYVRVGNSLYASENQSYGLTTVRKKHVRIRHNKAKVHFKGKNQSNWQLEISNPKLVKIIQKCEEIPGYQLFKYKDANGETHPIDSNDLNLYLKDISGGDFTVKDFRTYAACYETFKRLFSQEVPVDKNKQLGIYNKTVKEVAEILGHTVSTCKKFYIYPQIFNAWKENEIKHWKGKNNVKRVSEKIFINWWKEAEN